MGGPTSKGRGPTRSEPPTPQPICAASGLVLNPSSLGWDRAARRLPAGKKWCPWLSPGAGGGHVPLPGDSISQQDCVLWWGWVSLAGVNRALGEKGLGQPCPWVDWDGVRGQPHWQANTHGGPQGSCPMPQGRGKTAQEDRMGERAGGLSGCWWHLWGLVAPPAASAASWRALRHC